MSAGRCSLPRSTSQNQRARSRRAKRHEEVGPERTCAPPAEVNWRQQPRLGLAAQQLDRPGPGGTGQIGDQLRNGKGVIDEMTVGSR